MQKDFCLFLLDVIPSLREYGNVSYHQSAQHRPSLDPETANLSTNESPAGDSPMTGLNNAKSRSNMKIDNRIVVPILSIDVPD